MKVREMVEKLHEALLYHSVAILHESDPEGSRITI